MKPETMTLAIKYLRSAGFPGDPGFDKEKTAIWLELLGDIPGDLFIKAIKNIIKTSKFFPTIGEIREKALKPNIKIAEDAWIEVLSEMNRICGILPQPDPRFSSLVIKRTVDSLGGLYCIWQSSGDKISYWRSMFIKTYDQFSEKEINRIMLGEPSQEEATKLLDNIGLKIKGI